MRFRTRRCKEVGVHQHYHNHHCCGVEGKQQSCRQVVFYVLFPSIHWYSYIQLDKKWNCNDADQMKSLNFDLTISMLRWFIYSFYSVLSHCSLNVYNVSIAVCLPSESEILILFVACVRAPVCLNGIRFLLFGIRIQFACKIYV